VIAVQHSKLGGCTPIVAGLLKDGTQRIGGIFRMAQDGIVFAAGFSKKDFSQF
jgi:hypothetical protein